MKQKQVSTKTVTRTIQETKDFMISSGLYNPDKIMESFAENMDKNTGKKMSKELCEDYQDVAMTLGLDTHLPVADSVPEEYRPFLVNMTREIEHDYDCQTAVEKSLAETIASSHVRVIYYSRRLNDLIRGESLPKKDKTNFYNFIGKEIDRAQRQLNSSILTLKQVKVSSQPCNITAKTAFIAQNQQINNYENNERQ